MSTEPSALRQFTEVRASTTAGAGLGLFATRLIPRGTVWWKATPENCIRVSRRQYEVLFESQLASSPWSQGLLDAIQIFGYINDDDDELIVAVDDSRFVNHSEHPNSDGGPEDPNNHSMATRDIQPGEEITEDYRTYGKSAWDMPDEPYLTSCGR